MEISIMKKAVKPNLHSYMGSVFEEMCRYYTLEQGICGKFDNFITRVGSWWGNETLESKMVKNISNLQILIL